MSLVRQTVAETRIVRRAQAAEREEGNCPQTEATAEALDVVCPQRLLCLPPSPPYTNPHLKLPIPLPSLDDHKCRASTTYLPANGGIMSTPNPSAQYVVDSGFLAPSLLSPPYSPQSRLLKLSDIDEDEEEPHPSEAPSILTAEEDNQDWQGCDSFDSDPSCLRFKELDLGEDSDDWDEPSFLKGTQAKGTSFDGLNLNLFGGMPSSSSTPRVCPPPSPRSHSSELPLDGHLISDRDRPPLFKPSDFDVFANGWDAIDQSADSDSSVTGDILDESFPDAEHDEERMPHHSPDSPSRRSYVGLPEVGAALEATGLLYTSPNSGPTAHGTVSGYMLLDRSMNEPSLRTPPRQQSLDFPSEVFQTPFNIPLILSSPPPRSPPLHSLLFAPPEPQEIPLPDSPEKSLQELLQEDRIGSSALLEENRLRVMQQEMVAIEAQARDKEAMLTEYITRLNTMQPPSFQSLHTIGLGTPPTSHILGTGFVFPSAALHASSVGMQLPASAIADFYQTRRREVQNAVAMRTAERRRRKQAKERARELEALLQLKSCQIRDAGRWTRPTRDQRDGADEPVVLAASGSDWHAGHTNAAISDGISKQARQEKQTEVRQLVAKMIFRRRDSPRPLSGKTMLPNRPYVSSSLSRAYKLHVHDDDELLRDEKEPLS